MGIYHSYSLKKIIEKVVPHLREDDRMEARVTMKLKYKTKNFSF
jgi:hypothetical protein